MAVAMAPVSAASHSISGGTVSASGMNSCGGWYHTSGTFKNYCPQCGADGSLLWNPKGVPEGEWTCASCDADYCICGHCKGHNGAGLISTTKKPVVVKKKLHRKYKHKHHHHHKHRHHQ